MLPDTLEGSIHRLTQNILADYTAGRPIDRIEPFNQPDRDVIIALIGKLRRIVFPGYFRDPAYHVYSAAHSLSALIEDTAYLLQKQIAIALRCGSSVTQEAAADIDRQAEEMFPRLVKELAEKEGVTEAIKAENQMLWVQKMNNIRNAAMEIVSNDLIYA